MNRSPGGAPARSFLRRFLDVLILPAVSGGLLALAVTPNPNLALALTFLVPMFLARPCKRSEALLRGLVLGIFYYLGTVSWTLNVPGFEVWHLMPVVLYLSIFFAAWTLCLESTRAENVSIQALVLAALWVVLEYARNNFGFLALPWAGVAHAFLDSPSMRQFAALFGEYGLGFFAIFMNVSLGRALSDEPLRIPGRECVTAIFLACLFAGVVIVFGTVRISALDETRTLSVRAVQVGAGNTDRGEPRTIEVLASLSRSDKDAENSPDLVVWPEGSVKLINRFPFVFGEIHDLSEKTGAPIVFGASSGSKYLRKNSEYASGTMINELAIIDSSSDRVQKYGKRKLVPFGEYIPYSERFSWPDWLVPNIIEVEVPKGPPERLSISGGDIVIVPAICWENLFSDNVRLSVPRDPAIGVNISDLSIFRSQKAVIQHNSSTVLRAIENGLSFIAVSATGPSALITPTGEVVARSDYGIADFEQASIPVSSERTVYWRIGDALIFACVILIFGWFTWKILTQRTSRDWRESERESKKA